MDVTSRESITEAKKVIQEKEGRLHILVNKSALQVTVLEEELTIYVQVLDK